MKKVSPMESMTFIWKFDRKGESHGLMVLYWKDHKETCSIGKDVFVMWFLRKRFVRYETTWGVSPIETDAKEWKFFHLNELKHKSGMEVSCSGFFVPEKKGRGCTLALFYLLKYFPLIGSSLENPLSAIKNFPYPLRARLVERFRVLCTAVRRQ